MTDEQKLTDYLRRVTAELHRTRRRLEETEAAQHEPVAVVSAACRFPGGVRGPEDLWRMLDEGRDAAGPFPTDRGWDLDALFDPEPDKARHSYVRTGAFLDGAGDFDAEFFGISPREALATDPQQRHLLETAWEAIERAGLDPAALRGTDTGVFIGLLYNDYASRIRNKPDDLEGYLAGGNTTSVASGRLSYFFGFHGPALTVDTACSSSLVSLHLAIRSLRAGECDLALAGGANIMPTPQPFVVFSRQRALSPDGLCRSFSDDADGTAWGEGVGMLVLERLSDARRNGHPVLAVLRGSAVNQDGASNGLTAPNGPAQERVIRDALADAGLRPGDVDAVEAHGTATTLGDPIEARALVSVFGPGRDPGRPLWLGSVKSNLGHGHAAAGVAGVIKVIEALRHRVLPRTLHVSEPTRQVDWEAGAVRLLTEPRPWGSGDGAGVRRAGVSSFGMSGTNAHVIIEEAPGTQGPDAGQRQDLHDAEETTWLLHARTAEALRAQASRLLASPAVADAPVGQVARALAARTRFAHRAAVVGADRAELLAGLRAVAGDDAAPGAITGTASGVEDSGVVYVFPGQGSQWVGMGRDLLESSPVFAARVGECAEALAAYTDWSLLDVLRGRDGAASLERVDVVQPVLFAVLLGLAAVWEAQGLRPAAVIGHSQGEIAAAVVAGALDVAEGARIVALRSRAIAEIAGGGGMAHLPVPAADAEALIAAWPGRLNVAALNGPASTVVAGQADALDELAEHCDQLGVRLRRVPVDYASHTPMMETLRERLAVLLGEVRCRAPRIPMFSTLTGARLNGDDGGGGGADGAGGADGGAGVGGGGADGGSGGAVRLDAEYWYRNLRGTVRFADAVRAAAGEYRVFVEASPHPVLVPAVQAVLEDAGLRGVAVGTLRRDESGPRRVRLALAELYVRGVEVDWARIMSGPAAVLDLPTYPFARERFWLAEAGGATDAAALGQVPTGHRLLGAAVDLADGAGTLLTGVVSAREPGWVADHAVGAAVLFPGTGFVELALRAGRHVGCPRLADLVLHAPLPLGPEGAAVLRVFVAAAGDAAGARPVSVHSRPVGADSDDEWTLHASGTLAPQQHQDVDFGLRQWPPAGAEPVGTVDVYEALADRGLRYGPAFRGLRAAWRRGTELFAEVVSELGDEGYLAHPAVFDAALHIAAADSGDGAGGSGGGAVRLPFAFEDVRLFGAGLAATSASRVRIVPEGSGAARVQIAGADGAPLLEVAALRTRELPEGGLVDVGRCLFGVDWVPVGGGEAVQTVVGGWAELDAHTATPNDVNVVGVRVGGGEPGRVGEAVQETVSRVRGFLNDPRWDATRLVLITHGAADDGNVSDLTGAALWGLIRGVQSEYPGRIALLDADPHTEPLHIPDEPQLLIRDGTLLAPRLTRLDRLADQAAAVGDDSGHGPGTVLVTGGLGTLGAHVARHLVARRGVRDLILTGRRGADSEGAAELVAELEGLGARVTVEACDAADRDALAALLGRVPAEAPLTGVVHAAGVTDDATLDSLDADRIERVLRPKTAAAWNLHELTAGLPLRMFVLFSSAAGVIGSAGQAHYGAANSFLDALAAHRRRHGQAAVSIAWGLWSDTSAMTGALGDTGRARLARGGLLPLSPAEGLALLDAATAADSDQATRASAVSAAIDAPDTTRLATAAPAAVEAAADSTAFAGAVPAAGHAPAATARALLIAARLDLPALRTLAEQGRLPAIARALLPAARTSGGGWAARLAAEPADRQARILTDLVGAQVAAVLGHAGAAAVASDRSFKDLGFDSLTAVELRNRLGAASGLSLPATLVFDFPTVEALAAWLLPRLTEQQTAAADAGVPAVPRLDPAEPIAVVGVACRFPGGVGTPEQYWQLLAEGGDGIGPFPTDRDWDLEALYDPDPAASGTCYTRHGGFLYDAADFDPEFFGMSPREALATDPQQRMLLRTSWEAVESAGIDPTVLRGSRTGVFAGVMYEDYASRITRVPAEYEGYIGTGSAGAVASGRIAYTLGLEGPVMSINTACSSSLVAMHLAAGALRSGECDLALAGGATVMATPAVFVEFSRQRGLAPDGHCKSFGADADGAAWSEGAGMLLLERLSDARRRGHRVWGVLRSSAINSDGASNGLTAPNGPSQQRVIRAALAAGGLEPGDVDAVEAHGTGTTLGDPIEAQALLAVYGDGRDPGRPLRLGSVKSNIGHTQAAAGVAGMIKMLLALRHGTLPRTLYADQPSRHVDWSSGAVTLLTEAAPWPGDGQRIRRAAVSSFGISGTNAHVIIEEAPEFATDNTDSSPDGSPHGDNQPAADTPVTWVLAGRTETALRAQAGQLATHLAAHDELTPATSAQVARTLALGRTAFEHRAAVIADTPARAVSALAELAAGRDSDAVVTGRASAAGLAILFPGQGSQRSSMAAGLRVHDVFASAFDEVAALFAAEGCDLAAAAAASAAGDGAEPGLIDQTGFAQPAVFTVGWALYQLFTSWGVVPDAVGGHSIGELVAVTAAGMLSVPDAVRVVAARGRLMQALPPGGAMIAVQAPETEVARLLADRADRVGIAAVNSPGSVVVSGVEADVVAVAETLAAAGRRTRRLRTSHAFHSPLMEPMLAEFEQVVRSVTWHEPRTPVVSNLTGSIAAAGELSDPLYWVRHVRRPVRFADGITALRNHGVDTFLELGADAALTPMIRETVAAHGGITAVPALRRSHPDVLTAALALGQLHTAGVRVDWDAYLPAARPAQLPTYAFQDVRHWLPTPAAAGSAAAGQQGTGHAVLGAAVPLAGGGLVLTGTLSARTQPWLAEHTVLDTILIPGAALAEFAAEAGRVAGLPTVTDLVLAAPMVPPAHGALTVQVAVAAPDENGDRAVEVFSRPDTSADSHNEWTRHATGTLTAPAADGPGPGPAEPVLGPAWPPAAAAELRVGQLYEDLADRGIGYGPVFQAVQAAWRHGNDILAEIALPEDTDTSGFAVHPALLDAALQPLGFLGGDGEGSKDGVPLPFSFSGIQIWTPGQRAARVRISPRGDGACRITLAGADGTVVAAVEEVAVRAVPYARLRALATGTPQGLFTVVWRDAPAPEGSGQTETAAVAVTGAAEAAEVMQRWLRDDDGRPLALVSGDPATWGLVRSAQTEHPGRFSIIDLDDTAALPAALAVAEPQVKVRDGQVLVPRLERLRLAETDTSTSTSTSTDNAAGSEGTGPTTPTGPAGFAGFGSGTVLITGGTGALARHVARHLVTAYGVRDLLLVSRSGGDADGADELLAELSALGAAARVEACDLADAEAVAKLLDRTPELTGVVHTAGITDDTLLDTLTPAHLERVAAPKADAAELLDRLTRDLPAPLSAFVLFSSAAATLGSPGQGNYAAANARLDALAEMRHAEGLAACSIAWGLWDVDGGLAGDGHSRGRVAGRGLVPMEPAAALALFDAALASGRAHVVAAPLDTGVLRRLAGAGTLPPIVSELLPGPRTPARPGGTLAARIAAAGQEHRTDLVHNEVLGAVATVLGHASTDQVDPHRPFTDLGFDSLTAVDLRNRLSNAAGLTLPATLVFDHPTPAAVADWLLAELTPGTADTAAAAEREAEQQLREALHTIPYARFREAGLIDALLRLTDTPTGTAADTTAAAGTGSTGSAVDVDDLDTDDLVRLVLGDAAP